MVKIEGVDDVQGRTMNFLEGVYIYIYTCMVYYDTLRALDSHHFDLENLFGGSEATKKLWVSILLHIPKWGTKELLKEPHDRNSLVSVVCALWLSRIAMENCYFLCLVCLLKRVILNIKLLVNQRVCPIMSFYIPLYSHCIPIVFLIGNATIHYSVGSLIKLSILQLDIPIVQ